LLLLLFKPTQRLAAVFIKGAVAARGGAPPAEPTAVARGALAHTVHSVLHPRHLVLPAVVAGVVPTSHASAPYQEGQDGEAERPKHDETQDHQGDPRRLAQFVQFFRDQHDRSSPVNVNNINIADPAGMSMAG